MKCFVDDAADRGPAAMKRKQEENAGGDRHQSSQKMCAARARIFLLLLLTFQVKSSDPGGAGEVWWNDDVLGLLIFKSGLQDPQGALASWNEEHSSPCNWTGIRCSSSSNGRVESISLDGLSLSGSIGRGLLKLESLRTLSLSANNLSGNLLPELLQSLEFVDLKSNRFSGPLPLLGPSIRYADLSENAFTGEIPAGFFGQSKLLRFLSLSRNKLYGELPESLRNQTSMITLRISQNGFAGELPEWIATMRSLQELDLSWNSFQGKIPSSLSGLSSLRSLSLAGNKLESAVPQGLLQLLTLSSLDLSSNRFSGRIPSGLFSTSLQFVNLSRNQFASEFPIWPPCRFLQVVDLSENRIADSLPARISHCSNLQHLDLASNLLVNEIPPELSQLQKLMLLDLSHNQLRGSIPGSLTNLTLLTILRLENNLLTGGVLPEISRCDRLTELDLSSNRLSGGIPGELSRLSLLRSLDLSWNNLSGPIPKELVKLGSLWSFNVSHNRLEGPIPKGGAFRSMDRSSFEGNPYLCGSSIDVSCSRVPKPIVLNPNASSNPAGLIQTPGSSNASSRGKNKIVLSVSAIIAISAAAVIALGIVVVSVLNIRAQAAVTAPPHKSAFFMVDTNSSSPINSSASEDFAMGKLVMFTNAGEEGRSEELLPSAHTLLNKEQEVGRGGLGVVYRAVLSDGRTLAVKKLLLSPCLLKPQLEFEKEVQQLGRIEHPNLVPLQGYYWTPRMQLLISDFVPNGSLYRRLHERSPGEAPLCWPERFKIISGIANGLWHLHQRAGMVHSDMKSGNVLLGPDNRAVLCDFGLANLLVRPVAQGSVGYSAPELMSGCSSEKADVYGFGVVVLEVVTGRRPVEYMEDDVMLICDYVRGLVNEGRIGGLCSAGGDWVEEEVIGVVKVGLMCCSPVAASRPNMAEVVQILELLRGDYYSSG